MAKLTLKKVLTEAKGESPDEGSIWDLGGGEIFFLIDVYTSRGEGIEFDLDARTPAVSAGTSSVPIKDFDRMKEIKKLSGTQRKALQAALQRDPREDGMRENYLKNRKMTQQLKDKWRLKNKF